MGDDTSEAMSLDLNLSPGPEPMPGPATNRSMNLDSWDDDQLRRIREAVRIGARQRSRWRRFHLAPDTDRISMELNHLMVSSGTSTLQPGEGSVAEERPSSVAAATELPKMLENNNNNGFSEEEDSGNKEDTEKGNGNDGSFFDCNICLDLAKSPVVTCCGHLFCWPCLYKWLHLHSDAKECPVCKGEVSLKSVTPIYGRGGNYKRDPEEDSSLKIPDRPPARRVESLRQTIQRNMLSLPMDEMIRRLGSRFDLRGELFQPQEPESARETAERANSLLNRILTARGLRREQNPVTPSIDEEMDLNQASPAGSDSGEGRRLHSLLLRRTQSNRPAFPSLSSSFLVEAFRGQPGGRSQEQQQANNPVVHDDRDSFSSIAAVINSESQMDTAAEIDSLVSLSTSTSRRRSDTSRASDLDTGDSRAPRRRRLN